MFTRIMCDGVKVGLRFISDCKTDNNKSVKSFEMKMPYFDEMHYNDKNFVNPFITAKNKMLFDDTVKHDSTENFYRLLKRYSHGKSYLTVEEFSQLVKAIGYIICICYDDVSLVIAVGKCVEMLHLQGHGQPHGNENRADHALRSDEHLAEPQLVLYPETALHHVDGVKPRHYHGGNDAANS